MRRCPLYRLSFDPDFLQQNGGDLCYFTQMLCPFKTWLSSRTSRFCQCERTVLVRNVGDRASKLLCKTTAPFRCACQT